MYTRNMRRTMLTLVSAIILVCLIPSFQADIVDCGSFITISVNQTGTISSPNYPSHYPNSTKCIWRIQAPTGHHVQLSAPSVDGERRSGKCRDFIQLREGSRTEATITDDICDASFSHSSTARWMWIMFKSDSNNSNTGFQATYTTLQAMDNSTIDSVLSPIENCKSHQFECANKECLPYAYRCDGDNDCGCLYDCDEDGCGGTNLSRGAILGIGIGCGVVLFGLMFLVVTIMDRKHHNMFFKKTTIKAELTSGRTSRADSTISSVLIQSINAHRASTTAVA